MLALADERRRVVPLDKPKIKQNPEHVQNVSLQHFRAHGNRTPVTRIFNDLDEQTDLKSTVYR